MKTIDVVKVISTCIALALAGSAPSVAQVVPNPPQTPHLGEMIDFDSAVGFSTPRQVTLFTSVDKSKHLYFLMPTAVEFVLKNRGSSATGLLYTSEAAAKFPIGYLTFTVVPVMDTADYEEAIKEIKQRDPSAKFAYPNSTKNVLTFTGIDMPEKSLFGDGIAAPIPSRNSFTLLLSRLSARALLLPRAYESPSASFQYSFSLRGAVRMADGSFQVLERTYRIGGVLAGFCANVPESTWDLRSARRGCPLVSFNTKLVREIQRELKRLALYAGRIDGRFGELSELAVRKFQKSAKMYVDGYPTRELLEVLTSTPSGPA
ncbi:MAG: peptidoglycan-binding domain-containing protein [Panacagrimonas sp.]